MKSSFEIRKTFLDYFKSKDHVIVESSPVIPADDPSLLFTNAGMNQFKKCLTGEEKRSYSRVADTQKCLRVSGKHNDFEDVGYDGSHHTFFEMLGNWSFGDYYKKEAIIFAWELLTKIYSIPKKDLYVTVHITDDEAEELWKSNTDIDPSHISRFDKENFWEMADTGPCGPCSEIHIDRGPSFCNGYNHKCSVNVSGCNRFIELWNLVFIQYNRNEKGELEQLKFKSVDTGMGLERLVAVLNSAPSNYDTDLFLPIIEKIEKDTNMNRKDDPVAFQVIADHIRALAVAIADGGVPSNEGRGYVLRKILRRAVRFSRKLGFKKPYLFSLVEPVCSIYDNIFPEIRKNFDRIVYILKQEEERFLETLETGLELIKNETCRIKSSGLNRLSGDIIFKLHDTYGFPVDITKEICREENLVADIEGFEKRMEEQRLRGKKSWKKESSVPVDLIEKLMLQPTIFTGYEKVSDESFVKAIIAKKNDEWIVKDDAKEDDEIFIITEKTPFYAESGGQVGDTGIIESDSVKIEVYDTQKSGGIFMHLCKIIKGNIKINDRIFLSIDVERRDSIRKNHTATHLLQSALRNVLGKHVSQAGSFVNDEYLRFDFTHPKALLNNEIEEVERMVNIYIQKAKEVKTEILPLEEAKKRQALAFFGEKYGEKVRIVSIDEISSEFCGGTHIDNTGKIGTFIIISEESVASGIRRIEAKTGLNALLLLQQQRKTLNDISEILKTKTDLVLRLQTLMDKSKKFEKEKNKVQKQFPVSEKIVEVKDFKIILVGSEQNPDIKNSADLAKKKIKSGVVFCTSVENDICKIVVSVTDDLVDKISAENIVKKICELWNGKGGGKPSFAQGATKKPQGDLIFEMETIIKKIL